MAAKDFWSKYNDQTTASPIASQRGGNFYSRYGLTPVKKAGGGGSGGAIGIKTTPVAKKEVVQKPKPKEKPKPKVKAKPEDELARNNIDPAFAKRFPRVAKTLAFLGDSVEKFKSLPGISTIDRGVQAAGETITMGDLGPKRDTGSKFLNTSADVLGSIAGFVAAPKLPGTPVNMALEAGTQGVNILERLAQKAGPKVASKLSPELVAKYPKVAKTLEKLSGGLPKANTFKGAVKRGLVTGPVQGTAYGVAESGVTGKPLKETVPSGIAGFTAGEAVIGPVVQAAGRAVAKSRIPMNPTKRDVRLASEVAEETIEQGATKETATGNAESFRERVSRDAKPKKGTFKETLEKVRTQFVDDLAPAEKAERAIRGGKLASAENSLYKQARLFKGNPTKANEIVRTRLAPVIESIEKQGNSYKDLGDYALAIHARDVAKQGIETGFKPSEIDDVIRKFGTPGMEKARQELLELNNDLLDDLVDSGRISKELADGLKKKYPNYMSLFRSFDDEKIDFGEGMSKTLANVANPIQRLKGSIEDVIDPIESMIKNTFKITSSSDRNRVARQLLSLADEDSTGAFVRKLASGEDVGRKNVLKVFEGGKEIKVEVEPELYKAMLNLDQESADLFIRIMQKPAALLRAGATLTPEFSLRNPMRDVLQAFVTSESKFNPIIDFPSGLMGAIFKGRTVKIGGREFKLPGEMYQQFLKDNGGYGNIVSMDRKLHREVLESTLKQPASKKFVNIVSGKSFIKMLRAISDTTETATKLGEYKAAIRSGASRPEAAYRARDLMDFARAGSSTRNLNKVVAFLNANIQGKSKIIRAFKENPKGVLARGAAAITLPSIGVYAAQKYLANDVQKEVIEDAPDWLKSTFWLIPVPGTDQVARIPKPFDLAFIFANPIERLMQYIDKNDPDAFDGFLRETLSNSAIPTMLTGLTPILEGMANYSWFRQGPIIPQREQGLQYKDQYDINTTETAKGIAKGVNSLTGGEGTFKNFSSPRVIDNTIQGLTAGLGRYATNGIDVLLEGMGSIDKPEKPNKTPGQIPVLRAFLVNQSSTGKSVDQLYKERDRLTKAKGSAKLNKEPFNMLSRLKQVERATGRIGDISKQMRTIENSPNLTGEEKRRRLDDLNKLRNKIARESMQKLKQ